MCSKNYNPSLRSLLFVKKGCQSVFATCILGILPFPAKMRIGNDLLFACNRHSQLVGGLEYDAPRVKCRSTLCRALLADCWHAS